MNAWEKHGSGLYLLLLHANFLDESEPVRRQFAGRLLDAATEVTDQELDFWLCSGSWREMLTAGWLAGMANRNHLQTRVREKLLSGSTCYAGQGLCFAMARFGSSDAADALHEYLARYLPAGEREYDQAWALGALAWLDRKLGTDRATAFATDPQLWTIAVGDRQVGTLDPRRGVARMRDIMVFVDELAPT
jgi:hypothetical protein